MILPDDAPTSPLKGQSPNGERGQQPPPSYGAATNQAGGSTLPHLQIPPQQRQPYGSTGYPYQHVIIPPPPHHYGELDRQLRRNARRRFCKALFVGILIWVLVTMLFGSMFGLSVRKRGYKWVALQLGDAQGDLPTDVVVDSCVGVNPIGFPSPNTAYTSFELPVSSEGLLVMARGSLTKGQFRVSTGGASSESSHAKLDIAVNFYRMDILEKVQICKIHRKRGEVGIAVLTPKWSPDWGQESKLHFDINLSFPGSSSSAHELTIKKLETDLPNFSQNIDNSVQNNVYFHDLILKGSNGYILAESIDAQNTNIKNSNGGVTLMTATADSIDVKTSNGIINGHYDAHGSLKLETSNAPIKVDVDLTASKRKTGELLLRTSNSPVTADVNFHFSGNDKETYQSSEHDFNFDARSSNGGLHLNVKRMPLDSRLRMFATTSNGIVNTWLPPAFEGSFELSSSSPITPVVQMEEKEDPWGKGRTRTASGVTNGRKQISGHVYWGDKPDKDPKSSLTVRTSNAPVTLYL